jgi:hypothetical protein
MKHRHFPCPYTGAPKCGSHIGLCNECKRYGRLTVRDRLLAACCSAAIIVVLLIAMMSCVQSGNSKQITWGKGVTVYELEYDYCQYLMSTGGMIHKVTCSNTIHTNMKDAIDELQKLASSKTSVYNLSIGISKNIHGEVRYSAMIVATDLRGRNSNRIVDGMADPKEAIRVLTEFLEAL